MTLRRAVALPIHNEAANLPSLLEMLQRETGFDEIVAVDDCSSDESLAILTEFAARVPRLRVERSDVRRGQLAAWRRAAETSSAEHVCFIDADAMPRIGAIECLFSALDADAATVLVSGRVEPDLASVRWAPARFRASALHRLRALQYVRDSAIGRFFAVRRAWFLENAVRTDIIANDAYLACRAARGGLISRYVPNASCRYAEARTTRDFAAQRQRANAGYAQLRAMALLERRDEPDGGAYLRVLASSAYADPLGAAAWIREQLRSLTMRAYRAVGADDGIWEVQPSTKRALTSDAGTETIDR